MPVASASITAAGAEPSPVRRSGFTLPTIGWIYAIGGGIGFLMAFVLVLERLHLLDDPTYIPTCSIGERLNCATVMASEQADAFGFPNPLIGVAAFPIVATIGVAMIVGARFPRWFELATQAAVTAALLFVHWLIFQSVVRIGALCPYCMVVWVAVIALAWYTTLHTLSTAQHLGRRGRRFTAAALDSHGVVIGSWYLAIAVFILVFL